jgi:transcriptional regulator with XRE-family HTH domain
MVLRVEVAAPLLAWARKRAGISHEDLSRRFPKLQEWESGEGAPTLKQLEDFASTTHTPVGYFFLPEPPDVDMPLPDWVRFFKGCAIAGRFGHAVSPRAGMLSGS